MSGNMHFLLSLLLHVLLVLSCHGLLNIEELTEMKYALDILNKPLSALEVDPAQGLKLASKHGQDYFCKLPIKEKGPESEANEEKIPKTTPVYSLLEPMRHEACLKTIKGWWTYEFCYGKYVKQYHSEDDVLKGDVTYLGYYQSDFDWNRQTVDDSPFKRHKLNRYHSQTYVNGTPCDVISHKRDTEIRFICDDSSTETYIARVDEPSTCTYVITVHTPYICSHPYTRPLRNPKPRNIECRPILNPDDYAKYEEIVQEQLRQKKEHEEKLASARKLLSEIAPPFDGDLSDVDGGKTQLYAGDKPDPDQEIVAPEAMKEKFFSDVYNFLNKMMMDQGDNSLNSFTDKKDKPPEDDTAAASEKDVQDPLTKRKAEEKEAIELIERFIVPERLAELDPFKQRLLVTNVADLNKKYKDEPSADRVRAVAKYIGEFVAAIEGVQDSMKQLNDFQENLDKAFIDDSLKLMEEETDKDGQAEKDPLSVKLKVHTIKSLEELTKANEDELMSEGVSVDSDTMDPSWKKLENDIERGLEEAGYDSANQVEIRLMTNDKDVAESIHLTEEDGERFRQMLLELVVGSSARKKEVSKQKALNDNYNLVWKKGVAHFENLNENEEETEDWEADIKSPKL